MELNDRVIQDVGHVQHVAFSDYIRVLVHHQPADMGKEETTIAIVWIGISFGEFVVHTVIAHPIV